MLNKKFEAYKIRREIVRSGSKFIVFRKTRNKFGELCGDAEEIFRFCGLYHEQNSYVKVTVGDAGYYRNKKEPMILCIPCDAEKLRTGDKIIFEQDVNKKVYLVSAITNIQEWGIIYDISLEEQVINVGEN